MHRLFVPLLLLFSLNTKAGFMAPVSVAGNEWLQPADFVGLSWNDISGACDSSTKICDGMLNGNDMSGWTWASVDDVNSLFNHYIGSPELGPGPDFYGTASAELGQTFFEDGWIPLQQGVDITAISGFMSDSGSTLGEIGILQGFSAASTATPSSGEGAEYIGGWFRRSSVPLPSTVPLIGLALFGLCWSRRIMH